MTKVLIADAVADDAMRIFAAAGIQVRSARKVSASNFEVDVSGAEIPDCECATCVVHTDRSTEPASHRLEWQTIFFPECASHKWW